MVNESAVGCCALEGVFFMSHLKRRARNEPRATSDAAMTALLHFLSVFLGEA